MYLLNDKKIIEYLKENPKTHLDIENFSSAMLNPTSYYFRIGHMYSNDRGTSFISLSKKNQVLSLDPNEYVIIQTLESFYLSEKVFAVIGPSSDLVESGLRLVYGQFIDPHFKGKLEIGIHNPFNEEINLKFGEVVGKVCFFDISDTYPVLEKKIDDEFTRKKKRREEMQRKYKIPKWVHDDDITSFSREIEQQKKYDEEV